ncbi:8-amino-7-oxononanoate synthase [Prolixibacteraceae bacterium JC049]|nr:8-amino-7-oxononanoate synthase [Prolixibacteraceae bacterium JC049]
MNFHQHISERINQLESQGNLRSIKEGIKSDKWISFEDKRMLNLSSNDYLGLTSNHELQVTFSEQALNPKLGWTAASSRLLTGNHPIYTELENQIASDYQKEEALLFNSGYHANTGILPAITSKNDVILADKLVHASIIDGMRLSDAQTIRFRHNDMQHLQQLLAKYNNHSGNIIVVTESIFSMDGDCAPLQELVALKKQFNFLLYLDEAHAVGAVGEKGLGLAEELQVIDQVDFLVGTFGKALASVGAYLVCSSLVKKWLINTMRTLIFTTALPAVNVAWTLHVWRYMLQAKKERTHLKEISSLIHSSLNTEEQKCISQSHIIPFMVNDAEKSILLAQKFQENGFYVLPIRKPTVPEGTERLRFSLRADISLQEINELTLFLQPCR